jgi:hypothetical protein
LPGVRCAAPSALSQVPVEARAEYRQRPQLACVFITWPGSNSPLGSGHCDIRDRSPHSRHAGLSLSRAAAVRRGTGTLGTVMRRISLLLLSAALSGCASGPAGPSAQSLNAKALCQQLAKVSASSPEQISGDYVDQCLIARGFAPKPGIEPGRIAPTPFIAETETSR